MEEEEAEFEPPDRLEEEIDALMESLSDKVSPMSAERSLS